MRPILSLQRAALASRTVMLSRQGRHAASTAAVVALFLSGCAAMGPDYQPPSMPAPTQWRGARDSGTPVLIHALARAVGRTARLPAVPVGVLLGKRAAVARLPGSLYVDGSAIRSRLAWAPPFSMEAGLAATVAALA